MLLHEEHNLLASAQDMDPIKQFVTQGLSAKAKGDTFYYDNICQQLRDRDDPEMYWKVLIALSSCVTMFSRDPGTYSELVNDILSYDWRQDRKISIAFVNLVGHMVSSNATFLVPAFHALVLRLVPTDWEITHDKSSLPACTDDAESASIAGNDGDQPGSRSTEDNIKAAVIQTGVTAVGGSTAILNNNSSNKRMSSSLISGVMLPPMPGYEPAGTTDLSEAHAENLRARTFRIHRAIHALIHLVPSGQARLMGVLSSKFPHKRFSKDIIAFYVSQVLYICEYLPAVQPRVLDLVVEHALEMDVEIVIEDSGEVTIQEEYKCEDEESIFQLDDAGPASATKALSKKYESSLRIPDEVVEMADKLDAVLALVVAHIDRQLRKETLYKERLYQQMLSIFEERVLYTYRSKFVQFLYFYLGCRVERFAIAFCQRLLRVFLETGHSSMKLQSAVLYLASFLARANFVPVGVVAESVAGLLMWANEYISQVGADTPFSRLLLQKSRGIDLQSMANTINKSASLADMGNMTSKSASSNGVSSTAVYAEFDEMGLRTSAAVQSTLSRHETFFCCMQAASYVLCFYGTELALSIKEDEARRLHWERAMTSELNPLKYCLESVRGEFLRLAQRVDLFSSECWGRLPSATEYHSSDEGDAEEEDNTLRSRSESMIGAAVTSDSAGAGHYNSIIAAVVTIPIESAVRTSDTKQTASRSKLAVTVRSKIGSPGTHIPAKVPVMGTGNNPLESFFPFDPCLLQKMHACIDSSYRNWRGVPGLDPGAEFDYDHDDAVYEEGSDGEEDDSGTDMQEGGHSYSSAPGLGRRKRANTVSSNASSSLASQSESMNQSSTPAGASASGNRYMNSYLSDLAAGRMDGYNSASGIAYSSGGGGQGSGVRHLRDGISRHGSAVSAESQLSQEGSTEQNDSNAGAEVVWPLPISRPRLYSVGSTGSW